MRTLVTIFIVLITASCNGQLFNKLEKKKKVEIKPDSIYLRIIKIKTTVEDSIFNYEDTVTKLRYEMPECLRCIDTRGKKIGDVVAISNSKFELMIYEASRMRKRKSSRKNDLEN